MALVGDDVPTHDGVDRVSTDEPCSRPPIQGNDSSTFPTTCTWSGRADRAGGDGAAEGGLAPPASAAALRRLRGALSADPGWWWSPDECGLAWPRRECRASTTANKPWRIRGSLPAVLSCREGLDG